MGPLNFVYTLYLQLLLASKNHRTPLKLHDIIMDSTTSSQLLEAYEAFDAILRSDLHTFR